MTKLEEVQRLLSGMDRAEKAQVLRWVVQDLTEVLPGVESTEGVCGGEPCIARTRIPVWVLVQARRLGVSDAELLGWYPTLRAEDLAHAWDYYRAHSAEIDEQIRRNEGA